MAPFREAAKVEYAGERDGAQVYVGNADKEWTVGSIPHGGYVFALVLGACVKQQSSTAHVDPLHITAHFIRTTTPGPFEVHVRTLRTGKSLTNLTADLIQDNTLKVTAHAVFGVLATPTLSSLTLAPPAPYARLTPFTTHPSTVPLVPLTSRLTFAPHLTYARDPTIRARSSRLQNTPDFPGGAELGEWYGFASPDEELSPAALALFADLFPNVLPRLVDGKLPKSWHPTVVMSLEFKFPLPCAGDGRSTRTVGSFAASRFVNDPQGRHDIYVELWTAPGEIGEGGGEVREGWREEQRCLLIAHQMALVMPFEVNERRGRTQAKL